MMNFSGVGVWFNMLEDLERIKSVSSKISWITPIMAPDQSSVQHNRRKYQDWRSGMPGVKFCPWIVCDDPVEDYLRAQYVTDNYPSDGIVMNAEQAYEGAGKWKARVLCDLLINDPKLGPMPKLLSHPSSPAERYNMDWRAFKNAGFKFAPQAYWNEFPDSTPKYLYDSATRPSQIHVGWDYQIQPIINNVKQTNRWGRVLAWDGGTNCVIKDLMANRLFRIAVIPMQEGDFHYMVIKSGRRMFDYKTNSMDSGMVLGFQDKDKVFPTVGIYGDDVTIVKPSPAIVEAKLNAIPNLKGASLYLGETSTSQHIEATWKAIQ